MRFTVGIARDLTSRGQRWSFGLLSLKVRGSVFKFDVVVSRTNFIVRVVPQWYFVYRLWWLLLFSWKNDKMLLEKRTNGTE